MNDTVVIGGEISLRNTICGEISLRNDIDGDAGMVFIDRVENYHDRLQNRDLPDQHPMSAITGLTDALDSKVDLTDLSIIYCGTATEVI